GSSASSSLVASVTRATARSNGASVRAVTDWTPLTFRTYWRAAASISSLVAAGSRPLSVVMLRHMLPTLPAAGDTPGLVPVPSAAGFRAGSVPGRNGSRAQPGPRSHGTSAPERAFSNSADYLRRISSRLSGLPAIVTWFSPAPTPSRGGPDRPAGDSTCPAGRNGIRGPGYQRSALGPPDHG